MLLMALGTLCFIAGVGTVVLFRKKNNWLKVHKYFNSSGFMALCAGGIMAFTYVSENSGKHLDGIHQIVGFIVFVLTLVTLILGFYQFKAENKIAVRTTHRWLGRLSLLLVIIALMLGLLLAGII
jgi:cytochrome b561